MQNNAFQPFGPTVLVGSSTPVQAPTTNNQQATSYRIRNLASSAAYISWTVGPQSGSIPTSVSTVAPSAGTPSPNTFGMLATSIEVFVLPPNCWFLASAGTFEVTPGEGI